MLTKVKVLEAGKLVVGEGSRVADSGGLVEQLHNKAVLHEIPPRINRGYSRGPTDDEFRSVIHVAVSEPVERARPHVVIVKLQPEQKGTFVRHRQPFYVAEPEGCTDRWQYDVSVFARVRNSAREQVMRRIQKSLAFRDHLRQHRKRVRNLRLKVVIAFGVP